MAVGPSFDLYITNMIKPANNSATLDTTPSFSWRAIKGETDYVLEIADNIDFSSIVRTYNALAKTSYTVPAGDALGRGQYTTGGWWPLEQPVTPCPAGLSELGHRDGSTEGRDRSHPGVLE